MAARGCVLLVFPAQTYRLDAFLSAAERTGVELILATDLTAPFSRHGRVVLAVDFADPEGSAARLAAVLGDRTPPLRGTMGTHEASGLAFNQHRRHRTRTVEGASSLRCHSDAAREAMV